MIFKVETKIKDTSRSFRKHSAGWLVDIARKIYPESDEVKEFMLEVMSELAIKGSCVIKHGFYEETHGRGK